MKFDQKEPCATCPYRRSTRLALWHRSEFEKLMANDSRDFGATFGCHMFREQPREEFRFCVGWLLDQKRRGVPCLSLRLSLIQHPEAIALFEAIGDGGPGLYESIEEMVAANRRADRRRRSTRSTR